MCFTSGQNVNRGVTIPIPPIVHIDPMDTPGEGENNQVAHEKRKERVDIAKRRLLLLFETAFAMS